MSPALPDEPSSDTARGDHKAFVERDRTVTKVSKHFTDRFKGIPL